MNRAHLLARLSLVLLPAALGCSGELPPRVNIQQGAIAKEDLLGADGKAVWYYLQTVTDVPYATGFTFAGEEANLEKIRWDIQEKVLYARRAYEYVRGTEAPGDGEAGADPNKVMGAPIAAFAIEKHFDIVRDYNSATGEEINRIVENDTDRRWYERRFIRVDWSKNLISNFEFLVQDDENGVAPMQQEAVPHWVSDPDDPDAFRIRRPDPTPDDPRPTADYLELTSRLLVTPQMTTEYYEDGTYKLPACYLAIDYGPEFASTDCSAQEISVRHAFMRARDRDYDALVYEDTWMDRFGYFSTERRTYDPQYEETESGRVRLANRWNIWQRNLSDRPCALKEYYKPGPDPQAAHMAARFAADASCAGALGEGSTCSLYQKRCTLPPDQRGGIRPIVYYLSEGFPSELVPTAKAVVASWNEVLQVTAARLLHPKDNQADAKLLAQRRDEVGTVFELRENGCSEASVNAFLDNEPDLIERVRIAASTDGPPFALSGKELVRACSALEQATASRPVDQRFVWQRVGDMRYSLLAWQPLPTRAGLLGYGPTAVDPETGEIVQASAFIYGAAHDHYTAKCTDIVGLLNCSDDACVQTYSQGVPISDWVSMAKSPGSKAKLFSASDLKAMHDRMETGWMKGIAHSLPPLDWRTLKGLRESLRKRSSALAGSVVLGQNGQTAASRMSAISGTPLEERARNQLLAGLGLPAGAQALPGDGPGKSSLYQWAGPGMLEARRRARRNLAKRTVEPLAFYDPEIIGLALRYKQSNAPRDKIYADLRARLYFGSAQHEVGHTLGLRHNFAATFDAFNYHPSYWKLRTLDPAGQALPRYKTGFSQRELEGDPGDPNAKDGIGSYQYSSVMDYGGKFNTDISGLGYWDRAAIKFGYGELVEVLDKISASNDDRYLLANVQESMGWGEPQLYTWSCDGNNPRSVHYTEYPRLVGGVANLGAANRIDVPVQKIKSRKLSQVAPGCAVYADGDLGDSEVPADDKGRMQVPYRFCSDEYEAATPGCFAFDVGPDVYEQAQNAIDSYHTYYIFNNLKLDRLGFSYWGYLDTIDARYYEVLRSLMQFYILNRADLSGDYRSGSLLGDQQLAAFFQADDGWGPWTVAVDRSLNFFLDVLATPEPGEYWLDNNNWYDNIEYVDSDGNPLPPDLRLTLPSAKYLDNDWDFDTGYFWYERMSHVGVFNDKYLALWSLTNADTYFMGRDTAADIRQYAINYSRLYPSLIAQQMRGILSDDWTVTGHWGVGNQLVKRDFTAATRPAGAEPINPGMGFSVQFFAALLGVSQIPTTYDTSFLDSSRIWVKGSVEEITPSTTPVCFADPIGGKSFCAITMKDTSGKQLGIGAAMIERAEQLKTDYTADPTDENRLALQQYVDNLEFMRSITWAYAHTPL